MIELQTQILGGAAHTLCAPSARTLIGGWIRASAVRIDHDISYRQWSDGCTLNVTLDRSFAPRQETGLKAVDPTDRKGAVSFLPPKVDRTNQATAGTVSGVEVNFDAELIEEVCEQRLGGMWTSRCNAQDAKAFAIVEALHQESQRPGERLLIDTMSVALARHLGRRYGCAEKRRDDAWLHPAALKRVVERVRTTPTDPPTLPELAELAGVGVSAFLRAFRGSTGFTPAAFSQRVRIEHAQRIIESNDLSLAEVAAMTGFSNASHLARIYRGYFGSTPAKWRRIIRDITKSA